jgi:flagellar hook protein FlgE
VQATSATGGTDYYAVEDVISIDHLQGSTFTTGVTAQTFSAGSLANVTTGANLVEGTVYQYVDKNDNGTDKTITASVAGGLQLTTGDTFQYDASTHSNITSGNFVVATATGSFTSTNINSGVKLIQLAETFTNLSSESLAGADTDSLASLGLGVDNFENKTVWVDEKNPPIKISYDAVNQRFQFGVNHTAIGPGTDSNFRAFKVYGASDADGTNNLGIPASDSSPQTEISSTAVISAGSFVADGTEMQINAKRFGANVQYNSDTKTFTFLSGTTGEAITADGALSVETNQAASNIQVGRYRIDAETGEPVNTSFDTATRYMGTGDNGLMGVGASKNDTIFETARGLASQPARAVGASATEPLNEIFALSSAGGGNVFNISVNGTSGIIEVPSGNYVGSTLAAELQTRINQISDSETGAVVGGVTVQYQPDTNNFVFTTGTTGDLSTIKVKGAAKLGLDDVPLGVGSVPTIVNLVQATNDAGVPLFVNAAGEIVETPPDNLVTDYYPLYIDEGELTFDKTGQIISPLNRVHYEQQAAGFSISLDVDYSQSTQLSQPFSVNNLEQDGFTSGRLDGLDIDATGLLRANYTNGENRPLGKIVLANFNNQNGLKQVGNATFVETATSGTPTFGEAGAEGFGAIQSGSLERSNVDITEELVNLITAQRNFQASSKAIETSTQLTQAIINIRS